ncbi:hypothetical protein [Plantactinospora sp. GCM10030261]|uniref:hypothetical protein n=1 Tax=Plantactinospora sp. GCM10030261 TaxID=3273420 RepID=UPI00360B9D11
MRRQPLDGPPEHRIPPRHRTGRWVRFAAILAAGDLGRPATERILLAGGSFGDDGQPAGRA